MMGLALLGLLSLGNAARNWMAIWQGLDEIVLSLDSVDVAEDRSTVTITTSFVNQSDATLQFHELHTGLRLTGRSVSAQDDRFERLLLQPGDTVTLDSTLNVTPSDRPILAERLASGDERWNVSGRVRVSVRNLSEPVWLPFRFDVEVS